MKAEDTTIDDIELTETAEALHNFREIMSIGGIKSVLWQQANRQAKTSFKAGIKEVNNELNRFAADFTISLFKDVIQSPLWLAKLMEWGLNGDKDTFEERGKSIPEIVEYACALIQQQADLSFEAGIREVVGFLTPYVLERPATGEIRIIVDYSLWQSKLKEWGLDE